MKRFIRKLLKELKDPLNIIIYPFAVLLFFSPSIVGYLLSFVNPWHLTWATAYIVFWAGPMTPAIPLQLILTFAIARPFRRLINYIKYRRNIRWLL